MRLKGIKGYLNDPKRAVLASLILTVATVLVMFILKPVFPAKTAIFRPQSPVGAVDVAPGESVEVRFRSFTEFDSYSVSIFPDSPSKEFKTDLEKISEGYYSLTILNSGEDVLELMLESPYIYKAIEPYNETGSIDIGLTQNGSPNDIVFTYVTFFTALFVFLTSFAYFTDNLTPSKFYLIGAITLGLGAYPVLFPAWTAHDADAHFQAAYRFSNILLGKGGGWTARECDVEFFRGSWKRFVFEGGYRPDPASDMYLPVVKNNTMFVSADKTGMVRSDGGEFSKMLFYGIFNYLPLSVGLALGRLIRLSPMFCIHLARYLQGVVFTYLTWRAVRKVKSENIAYLLTLVSLFPMSLAYLTSFSYDGPVLTFLICAVSMLFCLKEDEAAWNKKNIIEAFVWFFLLGSVKGGAYVVLIPMVFMLLRKPLKTKRNLLPVALMAVSLLAILINNVLLKPQGEELFQTTGAEGYYSASFAWEHPLRYLVMCLSTLFAYAGEMITDSVGRSEGWNEVAIPGVIIVFILVSAILVVIASKKELKVTKSMAISFAIACAMQLLLTPVMLLSDTPDDYVLIMGVQGRYFRPMAPLAVMLIVGITEFIGSKTDKAGLSKITDKAGLIKNAGLIIFAIGQVASIIAMNRLYLGR